MPSCKNIAPKDVLLSPFRLLKILFGKMMRHFAATGFILLAVTLGFSLYTASFAADEDFLRALGADGNVTVSQTGTDTNIDWTLDKNDDGDYEIDVAYWEEENGVQKKFNYGDDITETVQRFNRLSNLHEQTVYHTGTETNSDTYFSSLADELKPEFAKIIVNVLGWGSTGLGVLHNIYEIYREKKEIG